MKKNQNLQRNAATKSCLGKIISAVAIFGLLLVSLNTNAQTYTANCLTTQIDVSTGLDNTGNIIPYPVTGSTQDPYWYVTMVPTNTISLTPTFCAELVDNANATNTSTLGGNPVTGAAFISYVTTPTVANLTAGSGMFWTYHHQVAGGGPGPLNGSNPVRFTRDFYIDGPTSQNITISMNGIGDDIVFIAVDATVGTPIFNTPTSPNLVYYNSTTSTTTSPMSASVTLTLAPGAHTLDVDLYDIAGDISAISLNGSISCSDQVIVKNACYGQNSCGGTTYVPCNDSCYWTVDGNFIHNGRNKFGTLSSDDIDIITSANSRGIMTAGSAAIGSSFLGWNTTSPTSIFHVNCDGNHPDGSGMSDVRFENLEHGDGVILVIDDMGHVFRTEYRIEDLIPHGKAAANEEYDELKMKYDQLQEEMKEMKASLEQLKNCCSGNSDYGDGTTTIKTADQLYQNTPNPFGQDTKIEYYITEMTEEAFIAIYDLNGRELNRYTIDKKGKGSISVHGDSLKSGMYIYSLIIDGQEIDTKKMVFTGN